MATDPRTPVLIGAGQRTWRGGAAPEPLEMWAEVIAAAAGDAAATASITPAIDSVQVVYTQTWQYPDPPAQLADRIGARAGGHRLYSGIGGSTPQQLVADTCEAITRGELGLAAIVGGEALYTKRQYRKRGEEPPWGERVKRAFPIEQMPPATELHHQVLQAYLTFALFESAWRARAGLGLDEHRRLIGELLAAMSEVAARNPDAWFPQARTADELITPTDVNRMVAYPYTRSMVSVMDVDSAGALLLASEAAADRLGVPRDRRVYPRSAAYAEDPWVVAAHADLASSPAMHVAGAAALEAAGVTIDDVDHLDLYSCFSSSVLLARDALGITDARPVTVTGGLPFFGGAGSAYMVQSIGTLMARLRETGGAALASGVGMHLTKHAFGVYAAEPGAFVRAGRAALQARVHQIAPPAPVADHLGGSATVAACSVLHDRAGAPERAVLVVEAGGERAYAQTADAALLADFEAREPVGSQVDLVTEGDVNVVKG